MKSNLVTLIFFGLFNGCLLEPKCSSFHYEEKLLEKMIRQEISVEAMKKEIEISRNKVTASLDNLQKERIIWEKNLLATTEKSAKDLADVVKETKTKVQEELKTLETEKENFVSKLKEFARILEIVLFSARNPKDTTLNTGLIMVFKEVLLNEGGAYNKENGIFTVPQAGAYTFSVQLCVYQGKSVDFAFIANDKPFKRVRIQKHSTSHFSCYNYDALTIVGLNDQVAIKITRCGSGQILTEYPDNFWNTFSGRLLYTR